MERIKVLVADDHLLVREGIVAMLNNVEDLKTVAVVSNGNEVVKEIKNATVDVVVMDVMMPVSNGIETARLVRDMDSCIKIILLSMEVNSELIAQGINAGASGYLAKDSPKSVLVDAIRKVYQGELFFNYQITNTVFRDFYEQSKLGNKMTAKDKSVVSKRELEVLKLISQGKSNREVADELFISVRTVDAHRNHIMKKINAKSTADLVKYAIKNDLVTL